MVYQRDEKVKEDGTVLQHGRNFVSTLLARHKERPHSKRLGTWLFFYLKHKRCHLKSGSVA